MCERHCFDSASLCLLLVQLGLSADAKSHCTHTHYLTLLIQHPHTQAGVAVPDAVRALVVRLGPSAEAVAEGFGIPNHLVAAPIAGDCECLCSVCILCVCFGSPTLSLCISAMGEIDLSATHYLVPSVCCVQGRRTTRWTIVGR